MKSAAERGVCTGMSRTLNPKPQTLNRTPTSRDASLRTSGVFGA